MASSLRGLGGNFVLESPSGKRWKLVQENFQLQRYEGYVGELGWPTDGTTALPSGWTLHKSRADIFSRGNVVKDTWELVWQSPLKEADRLVDGKSKYWGTSKTETGDRPYTRGFHALPNLHLPIAVNDFPSTPPAVGTVYRLLVNRNVNNMARTKFYTYVEPRSRDTHVIKATSGLTPSIPGMSDIRGYPSDYYATNLRNKVFMLKPAPSAVATSALRSRGPFVYGEYNHPLPHSFRLHFLLPGTRYDLFRFPGRGGNGQ